VGEIATTGEWIVSGTNGENVLDARARTEAEAWWRAVRRVVRYGIPFQKEVVEPSDTWVHRLTESRKADRDHSRSVKTGTGRPV